MAIGQERGGHISPLAVYDAEETLSRNLLAEPPITHQVDPDSIGNELDYTDMIALSGMFRRWALYEEGFSPESGSLRRNFLPSIAEIGPVLAVHKAGLLRRR